MPGWPAQNVGRVTSSLVGAPSLFTLTLAKPLSCEKSRSGSRLSKLGNMPGVAPGGSLQGMGPCVNTKCHICTPPHRKSSAGCRGLPYAPVPPAPHQGQGLTTARLTQAVASWVRVASSSWSCIFFSSFLGVEERGRREPSDLTGTPHILIPCSWSTNMCRLTGSHSVAPNPQLRHAGSASHLRSSRQSFRTAPPTCITEGN